MCNPALLNVYLSDHIYVAVSIKFPLNSKGDAVFYHTAFDCSRGDCDNLCDHLKDFLKEYNFKLYVSAVSHFWCWFQV